MPHEVASVEAAAHEWTLQMISQSLGEAAVDVIQNAHREREIVLDMQHGARVMSLMRDIDDSATVAQTLGLERAVELEHARAHALATKLSADARARAGEEYLASTIRSIDIARRRARELDSARAQWALQVEVNCPRRELKRHFAAPGVYGDTNVKDDLVITPFAVSDRR